MSAALGDLERTAASATRRGLLPFLTEEYLRIMRSRTATLLWAMMLYALVAVPFIMQKPQPELVDAIAAWLGADDVQAKLILFAWVDASMHEFAMIMGPVLAGGIIVDERARNSLDIFASKPVWAADYFTVKLVPSAAAFTTFYSAGVVGAAVTFPWRLPASRFSCAERVACADPKLAPGAACPACFGHGRLFDTGEPSILIKRMGQPVVSAVAYERQVTRCSFGQQRFRAPLPEGVADERWDVTDCRHGRLAVALVMSATRSNIPRPAVRESKRRQSSGAACVAQGAGGGAASSARKRAASTGRSHAS